MFDTTSAITTLTMPEWWTTPNSQDLTQVERTTSGTALFGLYPNLDWVTPLSTPVNVYRPKTALARRLWEIRQRIVASGTPLLDWDGVERALSESRGE